MAGSDDIVEELELLLGASIIGLGVFRSASTLFVGSLLSNGRRLRVKGALIRGLIGNYQVQRLIILGNLLLGFAYHIFNLSLIIFLLDLICESIVHLECFHVERGW